MHNPCAAFHPAARRRRQERQRVQQEHHQAGESSIGGVRAEDQEHSQSDAKFYRCTSCCCAGAAQGKTKSTAGTPGSPFPTSLIANVGRMKRGRYENHSESGCLEVTCRELGVGLSPRQLSLADRLAITATARPGTIC